VSTPRQFALRLALIGAGALAIRLFYALVMMADVPASGDGYQFHLLARIIAEEGKYLEPIAFLSSGVEIPTAEKPPLYPAYVALVNLLGGDSYEWQRAASCLLGAAMVVVVGLVGREVDGERIGLIAAGLAAVYPMLVLLDGSGRSESLYVLLLALALVLAYRLRRAPGWKTAAALGAVIGLAALTRSESTGYLLLIALPAVWMARPDRRDRLRLAGVTVLAFAIVIAPWQARNLTTFERPVALSTNEGGLLAGANCGLAYYGVGIGTWPCFPSLGPTLERDESEVSWRLRNEAFDYIGDHLGRLPAVIGVRVLRTWELWDTRDQASIEINISERHLRVHQAGVLALFVLIPLAIWGAVVLRRRGEPLSLLLAPIVLVTVLSALTYGTSRFRAGADVSLVLLAAVAIERAREWLARRREPAPADQ
jgi:4-amino-4-deoxy-L-arabinose transferase-like glycosyltransferase